MAQQEKIPLDSIIKNVEHMANFHSNAAQLAAACKPTLKVQRVTWEDCARNKGSSWGPCISDMTLQVNNHRMPVIRSPNFTDETWDVAIEKIPVVVGNHSGNANEELKAVPLKQYLMEFHKYMSKAPMNQTLNLLVTDPKAKQKDTHVIMSSQCCFLPIEKGEETKFNVALYNYQSRKGDPAVLVIVATSKGSSAIVIQGSDQKLLFNSNGKKADFVAQRLSDNRKERGVEVGGEMSSEERQDNIIMIIQVPLKQKPVPPRRKLEKKEKNKKKKSKSNKHRSRSLKSSVAEEPNIEAAIVKVEARTVPTCVCGAELEAVLVSNAYPNAGVECDMCGKSVAKTDSCWHCSKKTYQHSQGYDLCNDCGQKQLAFDELEGVDKIERNNEFPIRVTLQYYKSTDNGAINAQIMSEISQMLSASKKQADFVGSLVTETNPDRPTEWVPEQKEEPQLVMEGGSEDSGVQTILKQCGLFDKYYATLKEAEITDEVLLLMEESDLKQLGLPLGAQIKFRKALQTYKANV